MMNKIKKYRDWKVGDDVYIKGKVRRIEDKDDYPVKVNLGSGNGDTSLTKEGKYLYSDSYPCASFLPTEQSMPFDEVEIAVDTPVWVRINESDPWEFRFFSHFEDGCLKAFEAQKRSKEIKHTCGWQFYSFENPFD